jgi:hypothetical integral membrane protein (TIGR02206 family)
MVFLHGDHIGALLCITAATLILTLAVRRQPHAWAPSICRALAIVILLTEPVYWLEQLLRHTWVTGRDLPLQLSDAAVFVTAAALWWRTPFLVEVTYFWGLGAVLQALATPDLSQPFPDLDFILFYVSHGGVLAAAILLTVGLRRAPRPGSPLRVYVVTLAFAALIALVDLVSGWNYMYLRSKPSAGSLLNFLGPWPWYVGATLLLAAIIVALLYAPFWLSQRLRARSTPASFLAMLCT